jgi:hypothetical protein
MKTKIYLAKSNKVNPDDLMAVRVRLSKFDIELVEFKGGSYSHKPMLECDMLLVLPDLSEHDIDFDTAAIPIGKGLNSQIGEWKYQHKGDCFIFTEIADYDCYLTPIKDLDVVDEDDYVNHSVAVIDYSELDSFNDRFADLFKKPSNKKRMFVLINN